MEETTLCCGSEIVTAKRMSTKRKRSLDESSVRGIKLVRESLEAGVSEGKDKKRRNSMESASRVEIETFIKEIRRPSIGTAGPVSFDEFEAAVVPCDAMLKKCHHTALSAEDFKERLATFDLRRWSRKPDCIASFHCARFGWQLSDKGDALICVTCTQLIPVSGDGNAFGSSSSALKCGTELRKAIESSCHAPFCPWKKYFTPVTILCLPQGFDMFCFLKEAVSSFQPSLTQPKLLDHYHNIMGTMDFAWMEDIVGTKAEPIMEREPAEQDGDDPLPTAASRLGYFLVLSGWSMKASHVEDGVGCNLCLRQIPLWLCKPLAADNDSGSISSSSSPPSTPGGRKRVCELDPVNNHWWWCPWRRFLEFSEAATMVATKVLKDVDVDNMDFFEQRFEDSLCLKSCADAEDYLRLKQLIQNECSQPSSINELKVISPRVVSTVGFIMDECVSPPRRLSYRSLTREVSMSSSLCESSVSSLDDHNV